MSNLQQPFIRPGSGQVSSNSGQFNHIQQLGTLPPGQLPPSYTGLIQDTNSNSPIHAPLPNHAIQNVNNFNQSGSNSPAFNQPVIRPPISLQSSPIRPQPSVPPSYNLQQKPPLLVSSQTSNANPLPTPYPPNYNPQINDNTPPLIQSSQLNQHLASGPSISSSITTSQYPITAPSVRPQLNAGIGQMPMIPQFGQTRPMTSQASLPFSSQPMTRSSPMVPGPPVSGIQNFQHTSVPKQGMINGPQAPFSSQPSSFQNRSGASLGSGTSIAPNLSMGPSLVRAPIPGPPTGLSSVPSTSMGFSAPMGPPRMGPVTAPPSMGPVSMGLSTSMVSQPMGFSQSMAPPPMGSMAPISVSQSSGPPMQTQANKNEHLGSVPLPLPPTSAHVGQLTYNTSQPGPPMGPQSLPPMGTQMATPNGPPGQNFQGPPKSNMQNRYPQMPPSNYNQQPITPQPNAKQYPQYNNQGLTQQMGQLSVTKQGFDQLWGHHMVDLMQCRHILPEYPEDPPEIKLSHQFAESPNCSPEIFRCTLNRIPETNNLLQKSRLPLGILIHPFKDLNHLPVIQCTSIVRCRACRTYINPFVYFVDAKRWKCNLCYRVNDLPEEFQYDPVSKSYGDPSRRPEIKSATIEFIAPAEYMLRPPQPAVYLFLLDVSQIARESGYLQVVCDTLKNNLEQLPGDARTQVGFVCYDSHVHYYLMSEGLTRPKEMTVLDIDDVFLPSPESLLVNLGERKELVKELLTVLPQRYSKPGDPGSALGAALQAAYKLMAPTGGRITVFQTCLPNVGPGALQPREDPNARSSKDVAHLNPATDFYKRIALDCSGAQVAVDLFLLSSQYCDFATLSGMSKFSGGTLYHIPLFLATRAWHSSLLARTLTRYLTRKIGFEAVMRVRCTRGITIHTFHGNFFVRSTDLLSLPNVSPDAGFGMQLSIDESLADLQQVCFQAALLYTSSKGERRIRVHTMALPIASTLTDVLHSADQMAIIGLVSKMAVDRSASASLSEAREAVMNVCVDALSAHRLAANLPPAAHAPALHAPHALRLLPLYLHALLKRKAFRTGTSTRLDDRVADMGYLKTHPLSQLIRGVYPDLYPIHSLRDYIHKTDEDEEVTPEPPRLHLSAERINSTGAYLLDDGDTMIIYVCHAVNPAFLAETFGVGAFTQLADESRSVPRLDTDASVLLHALLDKLNDERPYAADLIVLRDNSPNRQMFIERLVDDRVESSLSYYEFLQHIKTQVK